MSYQLIFTEQYKKRAKHFASQHPDLKEAYRKTLHLLSENPHHPSLRLHQLQGKLSALHSVSINLKFRITLELIITDKEIILVNISNHDQVYQS
jgi:mRNA-degrading endonuclease YafQ of YafQ-DinJ toxin-antitoxin module